MSLEALAPDQRAVVQLVLQQERSYDDLAGLLGISTEAVRERARAGLERVGGSTGDLTGEEIGEIADYLLGQQSVSRREGTRSLLSSSADARRWANRVSGALSDVARSPLPGVPEPDEDEDEAFSPTAAPGPEPTTAPALTLPQDDEDDEPEPEATDDVSTEVREGDEETAPVRARPRPRPSNGDTPRPRPRPTSGTPSGTPRASKVGGALLIAGIALLLTIAVIVLVDGGDDSGDEREASSNPTATATAEATPAVAGQIELKAPGGGDAKGAMTILVTQEEQIQFSIEATNVPPSREGEAYAVWFTGGGKPKRLGFAPPVGEDRKLGVSGPKPGDEQSFPDDISKARKVVISRETSQDATKPGPIVLQGNVRQNSSG